jgi:hypothetical protein
MTRPRRHDQLERLARLLRDAWIDAHVRVNADSLRPKRPCWEEAAGLGRVGWRAVALCLLAKGVQPPKE